MKRVLILAGNSNRPSNTPYAKYFSESIKDYSFSQMYLDNLVIEIAPNKFSITNAITGESISQYDLVMLREYSGQLLDLFFAISKYLNSKGKLFFNKNYLTYRPSSKLAQAVLFYERKVNFPPTYFSLNADHLIQAAKPSGYPLILKDRLGMHGSHNYLAQSAKQAKEIISKNSPVLFVAQKFLPNDCDYRILIMGDTDPLQIRRTAKGSSHLNNTSQGGKGELVQTLPAFVLDDAKKLAKFFQIDVGGVDVLQSQADGKFYFLEVNNQPQLVTGAVVNEKMQAFKKFLDFQLS